MKFVVYEELKYTKNELVTALKNLFNSTKTTLKKLKATLEAKINEEAIARKAADKALEENFTASLNTEKQNRVNGDAALNTKITEEANKRQYGDEYLQNDFTKRLNDEAKVRTSSINAEALARQSGDKTLQNNFTKQINAETQNRKTQIETEVSARKAADKDLEENFTRRLNEETQNRILGDQYKGTGDVLYPGKIEYWAYQPTLEFLSNSRRLYCDGRVLPIANYKSLYNCFKKEEVKFERITSFKNVTTNDFFNEDGRQGYYAQILKIDYNNNTFTYRDSAGYSKVVSFSRVMGATEIEEYDSYTGYNGKKRGTTKKSIVYDYYSPDDFYRKKTVSYGIWDQRNSAGNIVYNGGTYSTATYFQLPDLREMVPVGSGQNTIYPITKHASLNITKTSTVAISNASSAGVLNKIALYPTITY